MLNRPFRRTGRAHPEELTESDLLDFCTTGDPTNNSCTSGAPWSSRSSVGAPARQSLREDRAGNDVAEPRPSTSSTDRRSAPHISRMVTRVGFGDCASLSQLPADVAVQIVRPLEGWWISLRGGTGGPPGGSPLKR